MFENPEVLFGGEKRLLELISLIYDAVDQPSLWPLILDRIAEATNSGCTCLLTNYGSMNTRDITAFTRTDAAFLNLYARHYEAVNVWVKPCNLLFPDGTVRYGHQAVPDALLEKTEFYNDFLRPADYFYTIGMKVPLRNLQPMYVTTLRSRQKGPYTPEEGAVLTTLLPHLQRALRLYLQSSLLRSGLAATIDQLPYGLALLEGHGRCLLLNRPAQMILQERDGLRLVNSRLMADSPSESARLRAMISAAVSLNLSGFIQSGGALLISRRKGASLQLVVSPFVAGLESVPVQVTATISVRDPKAECVCQVDVFQSLYGLTKAEAKLAALLVDGRDLAEAAAINCVTRETVRSQLKAIFQKTETRRQAELVRLLSGVPGRSLSR